MAVLTGVYSVPSSPAPDHRVWAADRPPYATAADLCAYLNRGRDEGREHARFAGPPWRGSYHWTWSWPVQFAGDAALDVAAQAEADRLARGGEPRGTKHRDSSWRQWIWVDGVGTIQETVAARDVPGDWDPARDSEIHAALAHTNGALRMAILHQDPAGAGPMLAKIGCGRAVAPDGRSRWWAVLLAP